VGIKLDKNYMVVAQSGVLSEILIFDKVKMCIVKLEYGKFKDITNDCLKLTKRKRTVCGGLWYQFLNNEIDNTSACLYENGILYHTNNEDEVTTFLFETQIKQLHFMIENARTQSMKYEIGKQSYTYKFVER